MTGNWELYLFLLPGLVFLLMFKSLPMLKISIAFKQFKPMLGLARSPWVGLKHFRMLLADPMVWRAVKNTLVINLLEMSFTLPVSMILAILINEITFTGLKKAVQTVIYIPHFFTWVVVYSVFFLVFGSGGVFNTIWTRLGFEPILFFVRNSWFRVMLVSSEMWHSVGWGTIIYLAAMLGIDPELYDAAVVDGANKLQQIIKITIPCLMTTFVLMMTLNLGKVMTNGFGQVLVFYNPTVYESSDIISTYVYRTGLGQANFSYAAAVGLLDSMVGYVLVIISNRISRKITNSSVW